MKKYRKENKTEKLFLVKSWEFLSKQRYKWEKYIIKWWISKLDYSLIWMHEWVKQVTAENFGLVNYSLYDKMNLYKIIFHI